MNMAQPAFLGATVMRVLTHRLPALGLAIALAVGFYWSVRLTQADTYYRKATAESLGRALILDPGNADYQLAWADVVSRDYLTALQRAVRLNPFQSSLWMELGLRAEMEGDLALAEKALLEAARRDRTHKPRLMLAHFYFRRGNQTAFWRWVREALATAPSDASILFRLCWSLTQDADAILERAIPARREIIAQYINFLAAERRWRAAVAAAERLAAIGDSADADVLEGLCDRLIQAGESALAVETWNLLAARRWVPYPALDPSRGVILTNPDFEHRARQRGFDWRMSPSEEITIARDPTQAALRISFTGRQAEPYEILAQYVPLVPATRYAFRFEFHTVDIPAGAGPRWIILKGSKPPSELARTDPLFAPDWAKGELVFQTGPATRIGRLVFVYRREPGTTRISGSIWLRRLALAIASQ